jgi:hypothetical protein
VLHESLALDHLVASVLAAHRALPDVPTALLVDPGDPDQGLRNPLTLTAAEQVLWTRWRSGLAARGLPALQLAADRFHTETRR